jgi:hypothetical protein
VFTKTWVTWNATRKQEITPKYIVLKVIEFLPPTLTYMCVSVKMMKCKSAHSQLFISNNGINSISCHKTQVWLYHTKPCIKNFSVSYTKCICKGRYLPLLLHKYSVYDPDWMCHEHFNAYHIKVKWRIQIYHIIRSSNMEWTCCSTGDDYILKIEHSYKKASKKQNSRTKFF